METYEELKQSRDQLRAEHDEYKKLFVQFDGGAMGLALHLSANDQLRAEVERLKAELEAKTDRVLAAELMANSLADQIGSIEPHEHPDEQKPRAQTWLQERKNWAAEVSQLRARVAELEQDKARLATLSQLRQDYIKYLHEADSQTAAFLHVHGWRYSDELIDRGNQLRRQMAEAQAAIDAARNTKP